MAKYFNFSCYIYALISLVYAKGDFKQGCIKCDGDILAFHNVLKASADSIIKSDKIRVYPSLSSNHVIKGISVVDVQGDGQTRILEGGVGKSHVIMEVSSTKGNGYHFIVDVYTG